jgi:FkbM family methyltransferase
MSGFAVNLEPPMTKHLVRNLRVFERDPLVVFDVGARGGINQEWAAFGDQLRVYCFEPDEEECRRLAAEAPPQIKYIPRALGIAAATVPLYEARLPASTGLYKTRMDYFGRFLNRDNGATVRERTVSVRSLDEIVAEYGVGHIDFIKLDVEGAELDVLKGGIETLATTQVLGILSEIRLHREINGSPPFAELDLFLKGQGFSLYDIEVNRHSRIALPYPSMADYRLPSGERFFGYTTRGQVQDGDALYFRDLLIRQGRKPQEWSPLSILKLCALLEIYSLNDCAAELILANSARIEPIAASARLLDLLAGGNHGDTIGYGEYMEAYFLNSSNEKASKLPSQKLQQDGRRSLGLLERFGRPIARFIRRTS